MVAGRILAPSRSTCADGPCNHVSPVDDDPLLLMSRMPGPVEHESLPLPLPHKTLMSSLPLLIVVCEGFFFCKSGAM
jgi:hypothetical protein